MNRFIQFAVLLAFISCTEGVKAQSWTMQAPYPTFNNLFGVSFPSSTIGYIGGNNGTLMKTTDGGITWIDLDFNPDILYNQFGNLNFLSVDTGYIAAGHHVYKTTDGGENWTAHMNDPYGTTLGTFFLNDTIGYAYGNYSLLYKTTDAGETWNKLSCSVGGVYNNYYNVRFANENTGYLIKKISSASDRLMRTDDGGITWFHVTVPDEVIDVSAVEVLGPDDIWISSYRPFYNGNYWTNMEARVYHTMDGGVTWTTHPVGMANSTWAVHYIKFFNQMEGKVMGSAHIYTTVDGGVTWTDNLNYDIDVAMTDFSCSWLSPDTCYISNYGPSLFKSYNGGDTLESLMRDVQYNFECVYFRDSLNGYAGACVDGSVGQPLVRYTNDGGVTWNNAEMDSVHSRAISDIHFFDDLNGIALYRSGFFLTSDGGHSWTNNTTGFYLDEPQIEVTDHGTLLIAGYFGKIIRSTDNGNSWEQWFAGFEEGPMVDFQFTDELTGYMAIGPQSTDPHVLYKTTDGGNTWNSIEIPSTFRVRSMNFANNLHGIISMDNDKIFYTTDGGITWLESFTSLPREASYIKMFNEFDAVVVNSGIYVATTNDGGATFEIIFHDETPGFIQTRGTCFISTDIGWSVASSGMIQKYDAHITATTDYELPPYNQAFLTPNPTTGIIRSTSDAGELNIRTLSGMSLFSKSITPGEEIDISILPAGMYLATLKNKQGMISMKLIKF